MKKYFLISVLFFGILFTTACNNKVESKSVDETEDNSEISVVLDEMNLEIPCDWTILSNSEFQKNGEEILYIESAGYDEDVLKESFGYNTTKECVESFLPNGIYLKSGEAKTFGTDGLPIFQYECTIDKYSKLKEKFIQTDETVFLDFLIDNSNKTIYMMYFLNDMADSRLKNFFQKYSIII